MMGPSLAIKLIHPPDKLVGVPLCSDPLCGVDSINKALHGNPRRARRAPDHPVNPVDPVRILHSHLYGSIFLLTALQLVDHHNPDGAQQSSRLERRSFGFHVGLSETLFRREFRVADDSVGPVVGHFDFELIFPGADGIGDFQQPGRCPDDTEIFAIQPYAGNATQLSEIEVEGDSVQCSVFSVQSGGILSLGVGCWMLVVGR